MSRVGAALVLLLLTAAPAAAQQPGRHVDQQQVHDVAARLRCVVCQNLSVADSPSEMATQMRALVRERLETGQTPDEVVQYFVDRYGEWILLSPRRQGFTLLVWVVPVLAALAGLAVAGLLLARWTHRGAAAPAARAGVDAAMQERIRRELERES
jgi:cytochrome c-type biogenesis protein CcmH